MFKERTWDNPNKMHIETGHKTFDAQTKIISHGNVVAPTQLSTYVRSINDVDSTGRKGGLFRFDMQMFHNLGLSRLAEETIARISANQVKPIIVYAFFHTLTGNRKLVHGMVVTDYDHKLIKKIYVYNKESSIKIIDEVTKYIALED